MRASYKNFTNLLADYGRERMGDGLVVKLSQEAFGNLQEYVSYTAQIIKTCTVLFAQSRPGIRSTSLCSD